MNNKYNTMARKLGKLPPNILAAAASDKASYENDLSNVARMYDGSVSSGGYEGKSYDMFRTVYVDGIGTSGEATDTDSTYGGATGSGDTGIPKKVEQGIRAALGHLRQLSKGKEIEYIHIDVFGFSRGAAAARHCAYMALNSIGFGIKINMVLSGFTVGPVEVRFAGLYDTVASFGLIHWDDTFDLGLDAIASAKRVIHIVAAEEHRKNFRLTNIASADRRESFELYLPGVHSDIGGGYNPGASEKLILWKETKTRFMPQGSAEARAKGQHDWLLRRGWFGAHGSKLIQNAIDVGPTRVHYVAGRRTIASNEYSYIPLNMMVDFAKEEALAFANVEKSADPVLTQAAAKLNAYAKRARAAHMAGSNEGISSPDDWMSSSESWLNDLRARYFHFSAYYMNLSAQTGFGTTVSDMIEPMAPEFSGGDRKRVIQNG